MTAADNGIFVDIVLNAGALGYINFNLGNAVAFGGAVAGGLPEPESYALLLAGLSLPHFIARRRKAPS